MYYIDESLVFRWKRLYIGNGKEFLAIDHRGRKKGEPIKYIISACKDLKLNYELRHKYTITLLLDMARIPHSVYYYYIKRMNRLDRYGEIKLTIIEIFDKNQKRYGYRRIIAELHKLGYTINHKTVLKLMNSLGLFCCVRIKKYDSYKGHVGKIAPNILNKNFKADKPNQKWVTDISEISFCGQKTYLSIILDLYNREIISYDLNDHANMMQINHTLEQAFRKLPHNTRLILHSDQGWQYQQKSYRNKLVAKGIQQSMSRKANCHDNAVVENFFSILKTKLLYIREFTSMEEIKRELIHYIKYYNNDRIKQSLNWLSPVNYRKSVA